MNAPAEATAENRRGRLILILGGARSGKSTFAETLAEKLGDSITYLATAQALDHEMMERVRIHRERRPAHWKTVEDPMLTGARLAEISAAAAASGSRPVLLLDCLTLLISNLLLASDFPQPGTAEDAPEKASAILAAVGVLADAAGKCPADVIIVANEVGSGLVPTYSLGRIYRDLAGKANQLIAAQADQVYLVVAGIPVELKELSAKVRTALGEVE